jgi:hypothetical protein
VNDYLFLENAGDAKQIDIRCKFCDKYLRFHNMGVTIPLHAKLDIVISTVFIQKMVVLVEKIGNKLLRSRKVAWRIYGNH